MPNKTFQKFARIYDPSSEAWYDQEVLSYNHIYSVTPGFDRKMKPLPVNSRLLSVRKLTGMGGFAQRASTGPFDPPGQEYRGNSIPMFGGYGVDYDLTEVQANAERTAISKLYSDLGDMKVNLAQNVAEFGQVINSVIDKMGRVASARSNLRKGNWGQVLKDLGLPYKPQARKKPISSQWLELQYGWLPLLSDVYESLERFVTPDEEPFFRIKARGSNRDRIIDSAPNMEYAFPCSQEWEITLKASVIFEFDVIVTDESLRNKQTWGLTNPALLAWELLPWSFVIDWFLPVGNYLEALTATQGLGIKRGVKLVKRSSNVVTTFGASKTRPERLASGEIHSSLTNWIREPTGFPEMALPRLKNPISSLHVANAVALIRQKMR